MTRYRISDDAWRIIMAASRSSTAGSDLLPESTAAIECAERRRDRLHIYQWVREFESSDLAARDVADWFEEAAIELASGPADQDQVRARDCLLAALMIRSALRRQAHSMPLAG